MTRLDDKDGNLIEHSTRDEHRYDAIVIPRMMEHEHEKLACNLDRILDWKDRIYNASYFIIHLFIIIIDIITLWQYLSINKCIIKNTETNVQLE